MASVLNNHCLICYIKCAPSDSSVSRYKEISISSENETAGVNLTGQLRTIFILRKVFKLPVESLEEFLLDGVRLEEWISLCTSCIEHVKTARKIFEELLEVSKRFNRVRKELIDTVKSTYNSDVLDDKRKGRARNSKWRKLNKSQISVTDECRRYVNDRDYGELTVLTDPFIAGEDLEAKIKSCQFETRENKVPNPIKETVSNVETKEEPVEIYYEEDGEGDDFPVSDEDEGPTEKLGNDVKPSLSDLECPSDSEESLESFAKVTLDANPQRHTKPSIQSKNLTAKPKPDEVSPLQCPFCFKIFSSTSNLNKHVRAHEKKRFVPAKPEVSLKCPFCFKIFSTNSNLQKHVRTHQKKFTYKCHLCDWGTMDAIQLERHLHGKHKVDHKVQRIRRGYKRTKRSIRRVNRVKTKTDLNSVGGIVTNSKSPTGATACANHDNENTLYKENEDNPITINPTTNRIAEEEEDNDFTCPLCKKSFPNRRRRLTHVRFFHKDIKIFRELFLRPFPCRIDGCRKAFLSKSLLECHKNQHEKNPQFHCEDCPQKFYFPRMLKNHQRLVHGKGPERGFACGTCEATFLRRATLNAHLKTHSSSNSIDNSSPDKQEEHTCPHCHVIFTTKGGLTSHVRNMHENKRPHICKICGFGCTKRSALEIHLAAKHDEVVGLKDLFEPEIDTEGKHERRIRRKPKSKLPRISSKDKPKLKKNVSDTKLKVSKYHYQKGNFCCHLCGKKFTNKYGLSKHIRFLHENNFFAFCEICGKGVSNNYQLQFHLARTHKIGTKGMRHCPIEGCKKISWCVKDLEDHLSTHTKTPRYQCNQCGSMLYTLRALNLHQKGHLVKANLANAVP